MNPSDRHVLLAGVSDAVARRLVLLLNPFNVDLHRIPWGDSHVRMATEREFDVIIVGFPVGGPHIDFVLEALRGPYSMSRHAGIILISAWDSLPDARQLIGRGANFVLSLEASDDTWRDAVLSLVDVSRRFRLQAPLEVTAESRGAPLTARCFTENVSMSGMLVRCSHGIDVPIGSTLRFAMAVPGEDAPIRGEARVARTTDPIREQVQGIGAQFVSFSEADRSRLRSVLARRLT
jgi:hypothetical protein